MVVYINKVKIQFLHDIILNVSYLIGEKPDMENELFSEYQIENVTIINHDKNTIDIELESGGYILGLKKDLFKIIDY